MTCSAPLPARMANPSVLQSPFNRVSDQSSEGRLCGLGLARERWHVLEAEL